MYWWKHWLAEVVDRVVTVMKLVALLLRGIEEGGEEVTISYGDIYY
jgi:hypothetical protein